FQGPQHTTVHLSLPVPPAEFEWRWSSPHSMRCLDRRQRQQLLLLTARTGSIANLEVLFAWDSCSGATPTDVGVSAAAAGQLGVCIWLWGWLKTRLSPQPDAHS
ncbi:hypothetical protein TSOC_015142, partial [Tetrabaena socialis]